MLLALAVVAIFAQIDRQSRRDPHLAAFVPDAMAGFALQQRSVAAIPADDPEKALDLARKLVRKRPIPAEHLATLSVAQLQAGEAEQSLQTIQLAAQRGWRNSPAQETVLRLAVEAGDYETASYRLAALWLVDRGNPRLGELSKLVLSDQEGRATFSKLLADIPKLRAPFRRGREIVTEPLHGMTIEVAEQYGVAVR